MVGLKETGAQKLLFSKEIHPRIVSRDGQARSVTSDLRTDRVNLTITDGVVTKATVG